MDVFKKSEFDALWDELDDILETMDIPKTRREDFRWLARNLYVSNIANPKFERAIEILKILLRNEEL